MEYLGSTNLLVLGDIFGSVDLLVLGELSSPTWLNTEASVGRFTKPISENKISDQAGPIGRAENNFNPRKLCYR